MRNKSLELQILKGKDPEQAYEYAKYIIKGRWPEAEYFIIGDNRFAHCYASTVIKGRWPEYEPFIIKNPQWAYYYALDVIRGRWHEAEPFILTDTEFAFHYSVQIMEERWPELEMKLFEEENEEYCEIFYSSYNQLLPLWLKYYTKKLTIYRYFK